MISVSSQRQVEGFRWGWAFVLFAMLIILVSCKKEHPAERIREVPIRTVHIESEEPNQISPAGDVQADSPRSDEYIAERQHMAEVIRDRYQFNDERVLDVMRNVPRHWFVPGSARGQAYTDSPLPIGFGQTISQPFIVAYMTSILDLQADQKVLEIGTGSGYQAAVLSELTPHVYTIEIVEELGKRATATFRERGYTTIQAKIGDGYKGWPEYAPFDAIIVTCAPEHIPPDLIKQLKVGGKMIIPVGAQYAGQDLVLVTKDADGTIHKQSRMAVQFVPLTRDENED